MGFPWGAIRMDSEPISLQLVLECFEELVSRDSCLPQHTGQRPDLKFLVLGNNASAIPPVASQHDYLAAVPP